MQPISILNNDSTRGGGGRDARREAASRVATVPVRAGRSASDDGDGVARANLNGDGCRDPLRLQCTYFLVRMDGWPPRAREDSRAENARIAASRPRARRGGKEPVARAEGEDAVRTRRGREYAKKTLEINRNYKCVGGVAREASECGLGVRLWGIPGESPPWCRNERVMGGRKGIGD